MDLISRYLISSFLYLKICTNSPISFRQFCENLIYCCNLDDCNVFQNISMDEINIEYIDRFLESYDNHLLEIDEYIDASFKNSTIANSGVLVATILRCCCNSICFLKEDVGLVIHEYLTVCDMFDFNRSTMGMINNIIDNINKNKTVK